MRELVGVLCVAVALVGCGSDDEEGGSDPGPPGEPTALQADAAAKISARQLVTAMEVCFTEHGSYSSCDLGAARAIEPRLKEADVSVEDAGRDGYTIEAASTSGATFQIRKAGNGALERSCEPAGEGGCAAGGSW